MTIDNIPIKKITDSLLTWIEEQNYRGWDPFDALNSPYLKRIGQLSRWGGIIALQLVKRCPLNLRPILGIQKKTNAKGMGLILMASVRLYRKFERIEDMNRAVRLAEWLMTNRSNGYSGAAWGYPFDWSNRGFYAPQNTPTIVNTAFIGHALLDLFESTGTKEWLSIAVSSCDFIIKDLNRTSDENGICFSYTPLDEAQVYNASLLGSSLLARVGRLVSNSEYLETAEASLKYCLYAQKKDGSWPYGKKTRSAWIDSFHTSYNLIALKYLFKAFNRDDIEGSINRGYDFYLKNFFEDDGTVKYYNNKKDPQDVHVYANAILFLTDMKCHPSTPGGLAEKVVKQMIRRFWSGKGYFYWQKKYGITYRLPCMRWVEAWALFALVSYLTSYGFIINEADNFK